MPSHWKCLSCQLRIELPHCWKNDWPHSTWGSLSLLPFIELHHIWHMHREVVTDLDSYGFSSFLPTAEWCSSSSFLVFLSIASSSFFLQLVIPLHSGTLLPLSSTCSWTSFIGGKAWPTFQGILPGYLRLILFYSPSSSPPPQDTSLLSRLRAATPFLRLISRTKKTVFHHRLWIKSLPNQKF